MSEALQTALVQLDNVPWEIHYRAGPSDEGTLKQIFQLGHYQLGKLSRFPELVGLVQARQNQGRRPLIIDGGANIGAATVYFHMLFPTAHFICVEPVEANMRVLKTNLQNISATAILAALACAPGKLRVYQAGNGQFDSYRASNAPDISVHAPEADLSAAATVDAVTLPDLLKLAPPDTFPFVAKFDIEGGERDLFSSNTDWIDRFPVIIAEPHDWLMPRSGCSAPMLRAFAARPRDLLILAENLVSIAHDLH
jgi:FkbM family methyltransferase